MEGLQRKGLDVTVVRICAKYRVEPADLMGPCRRRNAVRARSELVRFLRDHLDFSWAEVADAIGRTSQAAMYLYARVG